MYPLTSFSDAWQNRDTEMQGQDSGAKRARTVPQKGGNVNQPQVEESSDPYTVEAEKIRCDICFQPFGDQIFMVSIPS
jgi:hypothetical protein